MKSDIGINQRIPISILEMALLATLDGQASSDYFVELAQTEYEGENRIKKALSVMNRLTVKNELMPFLVENAELVKASLRNKNDRSLILAAVICSAYGFAYDVTSTMGKYFHVQEQVITSLVQDKMAAKYGSNRSLPNAMNCVLPMLIEAGIIVRPKIGFYEAVRVEKYTDFALEVYKRAFLLNNPTMTIEQDLMSYPFFEFVR